MWNILTGLCYPSSIICCIVISPKQHIVAAKQAPARADNDSWDWHHAANTKVHDVIAMPIMAQLLLIAQWRLAEGEQVRQLLGALNNFMMTTIKDGEQMVPAGHMVGPKVEYNVLIDKEDVEAWLTQTKAMLMWYFMTVLFHSTHDNSSSLPHEHYLNDNEYTLTYQEPAQKKARQGPKQ